MADVTAVRPVVGSPADWADSVEDALRVAGDEGRAVTERSYLKSELTHFGVAVPTARRIVAAALRPSRITRLDELEPLVRELWGRPVHECRLAAALALELSVEVLDDAAAPLLEELAVDGLTWAVVDVLATKCASPLLVAHPSLLPTALGWIRRDEQWVRRLGVLSFLAPVTRRETAPDYLPVFLDAADGVLADPRFFVRKAIGWVLRAATRTQPATVTTWVGERVGRLSGVTMREAVRRLDPATRDALLAAHRATSPPRGRRR